MHRVLFICHGNICRSPMAEFVMKDLVRKAELAEEFSIASAATSTEEIGNPVYPPARRKLAEHGIGCAGKTARQLRREDYDRFDLLIGMDGANLVVSEVFATPGPILKRGRATARGRYSRILKRTSHIVVTVAEKEEA